MLMPPTKPSTSGIAILPSGFTRGIWDFLDPGGHG
jgi:hypothetical protein